MKQVFENEISRISFPRSQVKESFQIADNWLFSKKEDFAVFTLPVIIGILLVPVIQGSVDAVITLAVLYFLDIFISNGHVNSTLYRAYFDRSEWDFRRSLLYLIPLLCFAISVSIYLCFGGSGLGTAIFYANLFHVIRQPVGWLACVRSKNRCSVPQDRSWDNWLVYLSIGLPLIYWHVQTGRLDRLGVSLSPALKSLSSDVLVVAFWLSIGAYFIREAIFASKTRGLNLSKYQIILTTCGVWYLGFVISDPFTFGAMLKLSHGVPYYYLIYKYSSGSPNSSLNLKKLLNLGLVAFFIPVILAAHFRLDLMNALGGTGTLPFYVFPKFDLWEPLKVTLYGLLAMIPFCHYAFDMYLWKKPSHSILAVINPK